jgi:hypothetical protein
MNAAPIIKQQNHMLARWTAVATCALALVCTAAGQERKLTLQEAIDLAKRQNHGLKAASYAVAAEQQKRRIAESNYFPTITNESNLLHITDLQRIEVPAGAFGAIPGGAAIPASNIFLTQGTKTLKPAAPCSLSRSHN